jgi:hypothetical protein
MGVIGSKVVEVPSTLRRKGDPLEVFVHKRTQGGERRGAPMYPLQNYKQNLALNILCVTGRRMDCVFRLFCVRFS